MSDILTCRFCVFFQKTIDVIKNQVNIRKFKLDFSSDPHNFFIYDSMLRYVPLELTHQYFECVGLSEAKLV